MGKKKKKKVQQQQQQKEKEKIQQNIEGNLKEGVMNIIKPEDISPTPPAPISYSASASSSSSSHTPAAYVYQPASSVSSAAVLSADDIHSTLDDDDGDG